MSISLTVLEAHAVNNAVSAVQNGATITKGSQALKREFNTQWEDVGAGFVSAYVVEGMKLLTLIEFMGLATYGEYYDEAIHRHIMTTAWDKFQ